MSDIIKDLPCAVVKDLLPLYHDGVVSNDTGKMIEAHLDCCESCFKELESICNDDKIERGIIEYNNETSFNAFRNGVSAIRKKGTIRGVLIAAAIVAVALGSFIFLRTNSVIKVPFDQLKIDEKQANINLQPLGKIVGFVEQGKADSPELEEYLRETLSPWAEQGLDALVLGCTHFPFVREQIRRIVGPRTEILDGAEGTVREAMRQLMKREWLCVAARKGSVEICQSGSDEAWILRAKQMQGCEGRDVF